MESALLLRERTVVISGRLGTVTQAMMSRLTSEGADVALIDKDAAQAEKFCSQLSDQREINSKFGRAIALVTDTSQADQIKESISKVAQSFGGIDIYIDAQLTSQPTPLTGEPSENLNLLMEQGLRSSILVTNQVISYFRGRKRGRIIYLLLEPWLKGTVDDVMMSAIRGGLPAFALGLSKQLQEFQVSVNSLTVGMTEEYLLEHYPGMSVKEALEKYKQVDAYARITEPDKVASTVLYLASAAGAALTGQNMRLV